MNGLCRCVVVLLVVLLSAHAVHAADKPEDPLWGQIQFEEVQARATGIAGVQSLVFDNFGIDNNSGDINLLERKLVSMNLPLNLGPSQTASGFNADLRGSLARSEGARATLVFLFGGASAVVQYPPLDDRDPIATQEVLVSLTSDEPLAAGASVPLTILLLVQKPTPDGSVLFSVDSVDMALGVE